MAGEGQVVLVSGEPGIGKSRLTVTLEERLADRSTSRLRYFCSPHHQDSALFPFVDQFGREAGFARDDTPGDPPDETGGAAGPMRVCRIGRSVTGRLLALPVPEHGITASLSPQRKKESGHCWR